MKVYYSLSVLLLFAVLILVPAIAHSKENLIDLEMLDHSLSDFEGTNVDAFVHPENEISYAQPGVQKYDDFFQETAIVLGIVREMRFTLDQINEGKLSAVDAKPVILFGTEALPDLEDRIPALISQGGGFDPAKDFPGFRNKMKIPTVVAGLADVSSRLKDSANEIPEILQGLREVAPASVR